ncbi:MAG: TetR family transcriptional regulator C-terminal domain-containing protein [Pseudomonadota bacterium]
MALKELKQKPEKRTASRELRRKQLISAAMDSISKRGFSGTTLRHVTQKAKVAHGVVNYHFKTKEALYDATLGYLAQEHFDLWSKLLSEAGDDPAQQLVAILRADFDKKICTHKKISVWFAFWGQAKYRPNYLKIHNRYDNQRHEVIERICSELIQDGGYLNLVPDRAVRVVEAATDGAWLNILLYPDSTDAQMCYEDSLKTLELLFPKHFPLSDASTH